MAACSLSTPGPGTSSVARPHSWPSPTCPARSIASAAAARPRFAIRAGKSSRGRAPGQTIWCGSSETSDPRSASARRNRSPDSVTPAFRRWLRSDSRTPRRMRAGTWSGRSRASTARPHAKRCELRSPIATNRFATPPPIPPACGETPALVPRCSGRCRRPRLPSSAWPPKRWDGSDDADDAPALLAAISPRADRTLEHSIIFALIEMDAGASLNTGLTSSSPHVHRAALIALDQMRSSKLPPDKVVPLLDSPDRAAEGHRVVDCRPTSRVG